METQRLPLALPDHGHHHLGSLAAEVHRTYFFKYPALRVRWGHQTFRKSRRSIRLGSYNHETAEIRVHPSLNASHIPAFFIQSIIHHEYLHYVLGPNHDRRFHSHERKFRYFRESKEWIRRHLFVLLGRRARPTESVREAPPQLALF